MLALAESLTLPGPVGLDYQNVLRPAAKLTKVSVAMFNQQTAFTEIIPADFVDIGVTVFDTDRYLGTKHNVVASLASNYRSNMRLGDTDYAISDPMFALLEHMRLLLIQAYQVQSHVVDTSQYVIDPRHAICLDPFAKINEG